MAASKVHRLLVNPRQTRCVALLITTRDVIYGSKRLLIRRQHRAGLIVAAHGMIATISLCIVVPLRGPGYSGVHTAIDITISIALLIHQFSWIVL